MKFIKSKNTMFRRYITRARAMNKYAGHTVIRISRISRYSYHKFSNRRKLIIPFSEYKLCTYTPFSQCNSYVTKCPMMYRY